MSQDLAAFEAQVRELGDALRAHGVLMASAESCTGGLIAATCTMLAGSSDWFDTGFVTYSNAAKTTQLGVALAVDDFGTGYSSLAYLKRLHPEKVKIDRSFVRDLGSDSDDMAVVQAIIRLGQALDFQIVGEGVETNLQRDLLLANGCRLLQGYRFARPLPAEAFEAWVDEAQSAIASER